MYSYGDEIYAPRQQSFGGFPSDVRSDGGAMQGAALAMQGGDMGAGVEQDRQYQEMLQMLAAEAAKQNQQKQGGSGGSMISGLFSGGGSAGSGGGMGGGYGGGMGGGGGLGFA